MRKQVPIDSRFGARRSRSRAGRSLTPGTAATDLGIPEAARLWENHLKAYFAAILTSKLTADQVGEYVRRRQLEGSRPEKLALDEGTVVAVGPKITDIQVGQHVCFIEFAGSPISIDGKEYLSMRDEEMHGVRTGEKWAFRPVSIVEPTAE